MFPLGVFFLIIGYAFIYTGGANFANGGQGPTLAQSLGFPAPVAGPGKVTPNLTGQPVIGAVGGAAGTGTGAGGGGGGSF
jgi:hypothetical protein